jgi:putative Mg2+ transporter-C (MgtC) family protein
MGAEREYHSKPAGLRTNILICLGAAIFTILSRKIAAGIPDADPSRITAQIVTGVGFIGAGAIMRGSDRIVGITTAAVIWLAAAVGAACGAGFYSLAIVSTILSVASLLLLNPLDRFIKKLRSRNQGGQSPQRGV